MLAERDLRIALLGVVYVLLFGFARWRHVVGERHHAEEWKAETKFNVPRSDTCRASCHRVESCQHQCNLLSLHC